VMYQNIWFTVAYLIAYKVLLTASHIYFHQKSTTSAYVLEDIVLPSPYAQITFISTLLFRYVLFSVITQQCLLLLCLLLLFVTRGPM